jgi:hypothetical protein
MKQMFASEKRSFKEQLDDIESKYESLKARKSELESEIQNRPSMISNRPSLVRKSEVIDLIDYHLDKVMLRNQNTRGKFDPTSTTGRSPQCDECEKLRGRLDSVTKLLHETKTNIEDVYLEKEHLEILLQSARLKM